MKLNKGLLNKHIEQGLQGLFYIVDKSKSNGDSWWQLRLVDSHFIMSAVGSKERVLECLETICKRYKSATALYRALRDCEHHISEADRKRCEKEYRSIGQVYADEVEEIVNRVENIRKEAPKKKVPLLGKKTIPSPQPTPVEEPIVKPRIAVKKVLPTKKIGLLIK